MLTVQSLVDQAKEARGVSWYRLSRDLGVSDETVTRWRKGAAPSDEMSVKLADMAGIPPWQALAAIHAQREPEGSPVRAAWEQAWQRLCIMLLSPAVAPVRKRRPAVPIPG